MVRVSIGEVRNRSFTFEYEVIKDETGELLATGRTVQVFTDLQGEVRPVPEKFRTLVESKSGANQCVAVRGRGRLA